MINLKAIQERVDEKTVKPMSVPSGKVSIAELEKWMDESDVFNKVILKPDGSVTSELTDIGQCFVDRSALLEVVRKMREALERLVDPSHYPLLIPKSKTVRPIPPDNKAQECRNCGDLWPCDYELAQQALKLVEGE